MGKCKNCRCYDRLAEWCDVIEDSPDKDKERDCECYITMTNADRIRSMSVEELAQIINDSNSVFDCSMCQYEKTECIDIDCKEQILKWLQSEVEE